jgi:P-type Ca2+ transporter type 2C
LIKEIRYKNILAPFLLGVSIIYFLLINNAPVFKNMFGIESLEMQDLMITIIVATASVSWIEIGKSVNHYRLRNRQAAGKYQAVKLI